MVTQFQMHPWQKLPATVQKGTLYSSNLADPHPFHPATTHCWGGNLRPSPRLHHNMKNFCRRHCISPSVQLPRGPGPSQMMASRGTSQMMLFNLQSPSAIPPSTEAQTSSLFLKPFNNTAKESRRWSSSRVAYKFEVLVVLLHWEADIVLFTPFHLSGSFSY